MPLLEQDEILDLLHRVQSHQALMHTPYEVAHHDMGDTRSRYRGSGLDYDESRPYQQGDELRYMNWRLTARTGEMMMKVFREERRPDVFILADRRASMCFGTRRRLKVSQAVRAATVVAFTALRQNMAVGGVSLDSALHWLERGFGERAVFEFINTLCTPCPPDNYISSNANEPGLEKVLSLLCATLTPGTVLYLISDFIDLAESQRASLLQLSSQHEVHAIHIIDPVEQSLPPAGVLNIVQTKTTNRYEHDTLVINSNDSTLSDKYERAASDYFQQQCNLFRSLGISYQQVSSTCDDLENIILTR